MNSHKSNSFNKKQIQVPQRYPGQVVVNNSYTRNAYYTLSFEYFDEKKSNLDNLRAAHYRKIITLLKGLSRCAKPDDFSNSVPMEIKPVRCIGDYKRLYKGLDEDEKLYEVDITECRAFFFIMEAEKTIQIIAIAKHPEDKKNRK